MIIDIMLTWSADVIILSWDSHKNTSIVEVEAFSNFYPLYKNTSLQPSITVNVRNIELLIVNITSLCSGLSSIFNIGMDI